MASSQERWDARFIQLAECVASWSKDRSRRVGCVVVGPHREVRSLGYNGFPRGVDDEVEGRHERPAKYRWTEHAERNAVYNATRSGTSLAGCTAYVTWYPCADCARAFVQSGIAVLVSPRPDFDDERWGADFRVVEEMLGEAGVVVRWAP